MFEGRIPFQTRVLICDAVWLLARHCLDAESTDAVDARDAICALGNGDMQEEERQGRVDVDSDQVKLRAVA
jgi:hypothetical protein